MKLSAAQQERVDRLLALHVTYHEARALADQLASLGLVVKLTRRGAFCEVRIPALGVRTRVPQAQASRTARPASWNAAYADGRALPRTDPDSVYRG